MLQHAKPGVAQAAVAFVVWTATWVGCAPAVVPAAEATHFGGIDMVRQQGETCTFSHGKWYAALMACACPAETLFHPAQGCRPVAGWAAGHERLTLVAEDDHAFELSEDLAASIAPAYEAWVRGPFETPGPGLRLASRKKLPSIAAKCPDALLVRGFEHAASLCDIAASMLREVGKKGKHGPKRFSSWDSVVHAAAPDPRLSTVTARWKSEVASRAEYVLHLQDESVLQRHLRIEHDEEELVLFIDALGHVIAGAARLPPGPLHDNGTGDDGQPWYFDASWKNVVPQPGSVGTQPQDAAQTQVVAEQSEEQVPQTG